MALLTCCADQLVMRISATLGLSKFHPQKFLKNVHFGMAGVYPIPGSIFFPRDITQPVDFRDVSRRAGARSIYPPGASMCKMPELDEEEEGVEFGYCLPEHAPGSGLAMFNSKLLQHTA